MIRDLATILGPRHAGALRLYLAWLVAYAVLEGVAIAFLAPVLAALLTGDGTGASVWLLGMAGAVLMACVARYQQAMKGFSLALVVLTTVHERLGDHVASLPLGWFSSEKIGRLSQSATDGTTMVTNVFAHFLTPVVTGVLTPATLAVVIALTDWRLGLAVAVWAPFIYWAHRWSSTWIGRTEEAVDAAGATASARVVEFARAQPVLRAFGRTTDAGYQPLEDAIEAQRRANGSVLSTTFPRLLVGGLSVQVAFVTLISVGVLLVLGGTLDAVALVALLALAARLAGPLAEAAARSGLLRMANNDLRRLAALFAEKGLPEPIQPAPLTEPGRIEFDQVAFGYRPGAPVLRDVSFRVDPRTMTAIIGDSGSGKTTIIRLIMRFFDVDGGSVRVGGRDVRELDGTTLMGQLSPVMQDVYLFNDTLEANIRVGRPDATAEEVREAARLAGVEDIVARLPEGWNTPVGEGGALLSGGERQRVSVARAVLKNAPIVLLDEATAALDPANERFIEQTMRGLKARSTLLVVAHRPRTIVAADQILFLRGGRIIDVGTHDGLLARNAEYARFWHDRHRAQGWRLMAKEEIA
ncbi:ABC transporter ATP-binding protein [Rhodospirillum rubrum]|uniref:ABC transporter component n=1 Tax=Rhodospirillum rubrum (strain ATCC 11170 / ATH 1.1.1 / DSM 467 / LMG 4362 / NCIMB 8255 / S1) TaxID=269796 RepID=Q2RRV6_RHORT|nr:ABC transporter ATP-binding protein [Rhodospirillum rubrum]ABC23139.1 ABC transporter component [Rhodospirillum rubrum ATCC 11170]AEO48870.1 ABC transporter protein [Rhodospirillum rubrum F11]MBK5954753.1 ABC transporter ATP-binding protein [Rhodospirillum rubrum]QXG79122.1 ABC transporter ATP-binding protein/permease [Rhodospirillum rubrum]HAQ01029.1 ABC transporter ATP-binding protein [Rhodospirillum rubrum]